EPDDAAVEMERRAAQRDRLQDDLAVVKRHHPGRVEVGNRELFVAARLVWPEGNEPVVEIGRDVEDVLVIRLLELEANPAIQTHQVGGLVEDLHGFLIEVPRFRGGTFHGATSSSCLAPRAGGEAASYARRSGA